MVAAAQEAVGTAGNPVTGVTIEAGQLVISFANGDTVYHDFPTGGIDTVAVQALIDVHAGMSEIHHMQGGGGGGSLILGNLDNGRLPGPAIVMRMGWGETNPPVADVFIRDNNHPQDGAAVGTSELTYMPPFPPALVGEHTLFVFIWLEGSPTNVSIVVNPGLDNQGSFTGFFTDGDPLEVEGVAGTVFVSLFAFSSNESLGFASPRPGPLLATQTWVTSEIANIMLSGGGITTAQAQTLIDAAVGNFQTATEIQAVVTAAIAALPDYQTLAEVNALITTAIDALTLGQTAAEVQTLIDAHAAMPNIHHAPGGGGGPVEIVGPWRFTYQTLMAAGLVYYANAAAAGQLDTWIFATGSNADARNQLLDLEIGDVIRIEENAGRYQTITLTHIPTLTGLNVTILGTADRAGQFEIPDANADVTVTVIPQGIDQVARDAAGTAQSEIDAHEVSTHNTDTTARTSAATAQAEITAHELTPHGGGGGGSGAVWRWVASVTAGTWAANVARDATLRTFPIGDYADYTALYLAIFSGQIGQVAIFMEQIDTGGADSDRAIQIIPNIFGFSQLGTGLFDVFPAWGLSENPHRIRTVFGATGVTIEAEAAIASSASLIVRVGVWA